MNIDINGNNYNLEIVRKRSTRNVYIRVKDDLTVYVTCNPLTSDKYIYNLINKNTDAIQKMIDKIGKRSIKKNDNDHIYYLGKKYNVDYCSCKDYIINDDTIYLSKRYSIDTFYKKRAEDLFLRELDRMYDGFNYKIPYPSLCIRTMKTRWGVCNYKDNKVTLNLDLIKMDMVYLDYVIIHELSHFIEHNHSSKFWDIVEEHMPDYKRFRKEMKDDE